MRRNAAFKSKDFAKAAGAAKLALELDAENMEASSLLKKAEQALKAKQGAVAEDSDSANTGGTDASTKPRPTAKGMFEDDGDDDDMFGD